LLATIHPVAPTNVRNSEEFKIIFSIFFAFIFGVLFSLNEIHDRFRLLDDKHVNSDTKRSLAVGLA
jgi:hypothetical protein